MRASKKALEVLKDINDSKINYWDIPETDKNFWKKAKVVLLQPKKAISLRLDRKVLDWFKKHGPGYQSRINAVLKMYVDAQNK